MPPFALLAAALAAPPAAAPDLAAPDVAAPGVTSPCATPAAPGAVEAALTGAEAAWGVDEAAFTRGVAAARAALRCLIVPAAPTLAARVHRVEGLAAFLVRDTERARAAFAAARALDPAYSFPTTMIPAQNPVRVLYDAAAPGPATRAAPPPARGVHVWVDGTETRAVPAERAALVQIQQGADVRATDWVLPGAPLPDYRARGEGLRLPLLLGAGALAAGTGVLWALSADASENVYAADTVADAEARQGPNNALAGATVAAGAAAVATGAAAFVFARW